MKKTMVSMACAGVFAFSFVLGMTIAIELDPFNVQVPDINDRANLSVPSLMAQN